MRTWLSHNISSVMPPRQAILVECGAKAGTLTGRIPHRAVIRDHFAVRFFSSLLDSSLNKSVLGERVVFAAHCEASLKSRVPLRGLVLTHRRCWGCHAAVH